MQLPGKRIQTATLGRSSLSAALTIHKLVRYPILKKQLARWKTTDINDLAHVARLKDLTVLLAKKHKHTCLLDLERTILRAEEVATVTPRLHPHRQVILMDLFKLKVRKSLHTQLLDDLDEATFTAREAEIVLEESAANTAEQVQEVSRRESG